MSDIQLTFIDDSNDSSNSDILIFLQNVVPSIKMVDQAWQVLKNLGQGSRKNITFPFGMMVQAIDNFGNIMKALPAENGQRFEVILGESGTQLVLEGASSSPNEVEVKNNLTTGAITAQILKDGKVASSKTGVSPGQKAVFAFKPILWLGLYSQQNDCSAVFSPLLTQISLIGVKSADIVLQGGGKAGSSVPFSFSMENVILA